MQTWYNGYSHTCHEVNLTYCTCMKIECLHQHRKVTGILVWQRWLQYIPAGSGMIHIYIVCKCIHICIEDSHLQHADSVKYQQEFSKKIHVPLVPFRFETCSWSKLLHAFHLIQQQINLPCLVTQADTFTPPAEIHGIEADYMQFNLG